MQKDYARAARLWGSSESSRESIYAFLPPAFQNYYSAYNETTRAALGVQRFEALWLTGRDLTLEQAIELARQDEPGGQESIPLIDDVKAVDKSKNFGLTEREVEVLSLVAKGMTDAEVAEQLVISPRTVSKHLQSIYSKIDVNSRSAATRFAIENYLS
jgi:DNA-binding NarL/FixJ family response regulator